MKTKLITLTLALFSILSIHAQDKKVAIVGFYTDKTVGYENLGEKHAKLIDVIAQLPFNPDFKLDPILEKFHAKFFRDYAPKLPFKLLAEEDVINDSSYINFESPKKQWNDKLDKNILVYDGYKFISQGLIGKKNVKAIAQAFNTKSDGVMFVTIDFKFTSGTGIGGTKVLKIKAFAKIVVYDSAGKRVFTTRESAKSKKSIVMIGGNPILNPDKVIPMCDQALNRLMQDLDKKIGKVTKKAANKL